MPRKKPEAAPGAADPEIAARRKARTRHIVEKAAATAAREAQRKAAAAGKPMTTEEKIATFGLDAILDRIEAGTYLPAVADEIGVSRRSLGRWLDQTDERRRAVTEARLEAGNWYAQQSMQVLLDIDKDATQAEISKARELSQRYAWMAKMMNRATYGDKQEMEVKHTVSDMSDEAIDAELARELQAAGISAPPTPPTRLQ